MDAKNIRYIVFLLSPEIPQYNKEFGRIETHEGIMFASKDEARQYAIDCVREKLCSRFIVATAVIDLNSKINYMNSVETFGFKNDKKNVVQLELFK